MSKKRGHRAARSGLYAERTFLGMLKLVRYNITTKRNYDGSTPAALYQYPVPHPFRPHTNKTGKNDCMLETGVKRVYCQIKNQDSNGTCDEKLAFSFDLARYALSDEPFDLYVLILLGTWWPRNPGIIEWARRKCSEFEMLAGGRRCPVKAEVLVGPEEVADWLLQLPVSKR